MKFFADWNLVKYPVFLDSVETTFESVARAVTEAVDVGFPLAVDVGFIHESVVLEAFADQSKISKTYPEDQSDALVYIRAWYQSNVIGADLVQEMVINDHVEVVRWILEYTDQEFSNSCLLEEAAAYCREEIVALAVKDHIERKLPDALSVAADYGTPELMRMALESRLWPSGDLLDLLEGGSLQDEVRAEINAALADDPDSWIIVDHVDL